MRNGNLDSQFGRSFEVEYIATYISFIPSLQSFTIYDYNIARMFVLLFSPFLLLENWNVSSQSSLFVTLALCSDPFRTFHFNLTSIKSCNTSDDYLKSRKDFRMRFSSHLYLLYLFLGQWIYNVYTIYTDEMTVN